MLVTKDAVYDWAVRGACDWIVRGACDWAWWGADDQVVCVSICVHVTEQDGVCVCVWVGGWVSDWVV